MLTDRLCHGVLGLPGDAVSLFNLPDQSERLGYPRPRSRRASLE